MQLLFIFMKPLHPLFVLVHPLLQNKNTHGARVLHFYAKKTKGYQRKNEMTFRKIYNLK